MRTAEGYSLAQEKYDGLRVLLHEASALVGEPKQKWLTLGTGEMVLPGLGLIEEAALLNSCINTLHQGIFQIAVLGACNTGKSTLLNAMLGCEVLPTGPLPTTAVTTSIFYDEHEKVTVFEEGNEQGGEVTRDVFANDLVLSMADISTIDAQGHIDNRLKHLQYVQITGQYPLLAKGIRLVDTPGLGVRVNCPLITPSFLRHPGIVLLFILNAIHPFPQEIETFIATTIGSKHRGSVFYVINRIDQLPAEEINALKRHMQRTLQNHFLDEHHRFDYDLYTQRVFFVSAKKALEASLASDDGGLVTSGMLALSRALEGFLVSKEQFFQTLEPVLQVLEYVVEKACQRISRVRSNSVGQSKINERFRVLSEKRRLETIERRLLDLLNEANKTVHSSTTEKSTWSSSNVSTGPLALPLSGPLEVLMSVDDIDIDDHLRFAEQVIERADLSMPVCIELRERVNEIFYRRIDPKLYMAVVGEFNSGKSTLINAFLRQTLLKTSVRVTTATSTRIRYASSSNVEVLFKKQKETLSYHRDAARLWQLIRFFNREDPGAVADLRECIHFITAVDRVADNVEHVVISHPAPFLSSCVIIDTPGMNAEKEEHARITTHLIEQETDVAVVVIPAPVPLSLTLRKFLSDSLRPFLHRCLFIVTQMDKIAEDEQTDLLENLRLRLIESLGLPQSVQIYSAAPKIVIDTLEEQRVPSELQHWVDNFIELESILWERLLRERALSIAERLLRLLTHLFEQLDKYLRTDFSKEAFTIQTDLQELQRRRITILEKQKQLAATVV